MEVKEESQENWPEEEEVEGSEKVCLISKYGLLNIHVLLNFGNQCRLLTND